MHISVPITMQQRGMARWPMYLPAPSVGQQYSLAVRFSYSFSPLNRIQSWRQQDRAHNSWVPGSLGIHSPEMGEEQMPGLHNCEVGSQLMAGGAILASTPRFLSTCVHIKSTPSQRGTLTNHVPHLQTSPF